MGFDLSRLASIEAGIAAVFGLVVAVLLAKDLKFAMIPLAGLIFMGSLGSVSETETKYGRIVSTWLNPVQSIRTEAYILFGAALFLSGLLHAKRLNIQSMSIAALLFVLMGVYNGLANIYHLGASDGIISTVHALVTLGSMALVLPAMLNKLDDWYWMVRLFALTLVVWMLATMVQVAINPNAITLGNRFRFTGLTGNPQHAAALMATTCVITLWLWLNENHLRYRPLWGVVGAVAVVMLGWTGSRTGMLMFVSGATLVLYSRVGRAILLLPLGALGAVGFASVLQASGIDLGLERLTSTQDTRSVAWATMLGIAIENPVLGVGTAYAGNSENSYLYAAASYGALSFVLLTGSIGMTFIMGIRLLKSKAIVEKHFSKLCDLCCAIFVLFAVGAMFEGYAIARVSVMVVVFMMFVAMASRILEGVRWQVMTGNYPSAASWEPEDSSATLPATR
jgi:hypothetical protein